VAARRLTKRGRRRGEGEREAVRWLRAGPVGASYSRARRRTEAAWSRPGHDGQVEERLREAGPVTASAPLTGGPLD
jgi:hypothetical protein